MSAVSEYDVLLTHVSNGERITIEQIVLRGEGMEGETQMYVVMNGTQHVL